MRIGYVVKRYPRFSETFVVNEILAHETAGAELEIFSLLPPVDTHFQDLLARVRSPVTYLVPDGPKASELWSALSSEAPEPVQRWMPDALASGAREAYASLMLARLVRERHIDHLHAHFATSAAAVAALAARLTGVGFTLTAHAKDIFHETVDVTALARTFAAADAIVTVSDHNVAYLRSLVGDAPIERVYNGLDVAAFPFRPPVERPPIVLAVGRLVEKKGFGHLIAACRRLRDTGVEFECRIVGSGPLRDALDDQIDRLGLREVVTLVGPLPQRDVIAEMHGASVFAAPCVVGGDGNRDGLPTVVLEAMALGTPCIATPVTGIPEAIRDEDTGLLVAEGDEGALADAIARMLDDPGLRLRVATAARRRIEEAFDVRRNAAALRALFASRAACTSVAA
jgi:colanic acid/amylovoran biosynthesis glycosyltransferase